MSTQRRKVLGIALVCLVVFFGFNVFLGYRRARVRDLARLRREMTESALSACQNNPQLRAFASPHQIVAFCNCVVATDLGHMSEDEIFAAADRGTLDPADRTRLAAAQTSCRVDLQSVQ